MATNYVKDGDTVTYKNNTGSTISSGSVVVIGSLIGVAITDILDTESGAARIDGVFRLPKNTSTAFTQGEQLQWDVSAGELVGSGATPATGDLVNCGIANSDSLLADTTADVIINVNGATITP